MTENINPGFSPLASEKLYTSLLLYAFSEFPLWSARAVLSLFKINAPYQLQLRFLMLAVSRELRMGITKGSCREKSESRQVTACLLSRLHSVFFYSQLLWTLGFL